MDAEKLVKIEGYTNRRPERQRRSTREKLAHSSDTGPVVEFEPFGNQIGGKPVLFYKLLN